MKFGQRIRREEVACLQGPLIELSDHFLRYKAMKKLITRISQTRSGGDVVALVNAEKKFFDLLDTEIARIHEFLESKTEEYAQKLVRKGCIVDCISTVTEGVPLPYDDIPYLLQHEAVKKHAEAPLLRDLHRLLGKVHGLERFAHINTLGCIKISKKHDKHSSIPLKQGISRRLMEKPIMNMPRMVSLDQYLMQLSTLLCSKLIRDTGLSCDGTWMGWRSSKQQTVDSMFTDETAAAATATRASATAGTEFTEHGSVTEKLVTKALSDLAAGGSCSRSSASAGLLNTPATAVFATSPFSALKPMFPSPLRPLTSNSTRNTESVHTVCSTPSLPSTLSSSLPSTLSTTLSSTLSSARSSLHLSDPQRLHQPEAAHSKSAFSALGGGGGASSTNQGRGAKRSACDSSGEEDSGRDVSEDELHDSAQGDAVALIRPRLRRRKEGDGGKQALGGKPSDASAKVTSSPVHLSADSLREHFNLPLIEAARKMGICATAIKKVCRKIGIRRWPYQALKPVERRMQALQDKIEAARYLGVPTPAVVAGEMEILQQRWQELMGAGAEEERLGLGDGPSADAD